jgi:hypothetical protein
MQHENTTAWKSPTPASERPEFGTTVISDQPGRLMPSPGALHRAFETAITEIERSRGQKPRSAGYATQSQEAVFEAGLRALTCSLRAIYQEFHRDNPNAVAFPPEIVPEMQVVASSPGSGKSTSAKAFMLAVVREGLKDEYPLGCAFVVQHVETAAAAYEELKVLLPVQVAVWTSEHDADSPIIKREPRFTVAELQDYPIIIVTHEFFKGVRAERARSYRRNGMSFPRAVTFVDEKLEQIKVYDVKFSAIAKVREHVEETDDDTTPLKDAIRALDTFAGKKRNETRKLETPKDDENGWSVARELIWFTTEEAQQYARSRSAALQNTRKSPPNIEGVFGFARCMAEDRAFIARQGKGERGTVFVGYEQVLPDYTGMVLLDATADIDGINALCPWRRPVVLPHTTYERLEIVHVSSVAEGTLKLWLQTDEHRREYVRHILGTVRSHVAPGQKALLVCKLDIVDARPEIEGWSAKVKPFLTASNREFSWEFESRLLSLTWWGGYGVGANHWKEADVVLLFDEFHLPQHATIAIAQGMKRALATEAPLAKMTAPNSASEEVRQIREGHLLRWTKQMALRGRSRDFDETGACGTQKLVVAGDLKLLLANLQRVFPGAKLTGKEDTTATNLGKLRGYLGTAGPSPQVSTKQVSDYFGCPWRSISGDVTGHRDFDTLLRNAGWRYVSNRGRTGAYFERIDGGLATEKKLSTIQKQLIELIKLQTYRRRLIELIWRQTL